MHISGWGGDTHLLPKIIAGQRLGQFRLAHPGGAQEDKAGDGPLRVLHPHPGPPDGAGDGGLGQPTAWPTPPLPRADQMVWG